MGLTRKDFLRASAALPLGSLGRVDPGAGGQPGPADSPSRPARRPNVVILLSDQHRPDLLSCAGNELVPTPNLDRIADASVRFTRAFCPYPVCIPSRMSFLTGVHAHTHGVTSHEPLDWRRKTIAHAFNEHGYLTALIGKMHFLDGNAHGFEFRLSFNDWLMYLGPKARHYANEIASYPGYLNTVHDTGSGFPDVDGLWSGPSPWVGNVTPKTSLASDLEPDDHFDSFVARESSKFIRRFRDEPFFLIAGFLKPHAPFYPPKGFAEEAYPIDRVELPAIGDTSSYPPFVRAMIDLYQGYGEDRLRQIRAGYLGNLKFVDTCIGEVYRTLEELDLLDDTIVVYTSDHGEMGGDHGLFQKFLFFEPSIGVPLFVSHRGTLPRGRVCRALTEYMGIFPTVCELAGIPIPDGLETKSFANLARDPDANGPPAIFAEFALATSPRYMVRTDRYKYNLNEGTLGELYDLEQDPGELRNRIDDPSMAAVRRRLRDQLFAWHRPERNPFRPARFR